MATDEEPQTPEQSVQSIRKALLAVEEQYPDSHAIRILHRRMEKGLMEHGHLLGLGSNEQIALLAGGGTPKTPGRP